MDTVISNKYSSVLNELDIEVKRDDENIPEIKILNPVLDIENNESNNNNFFF